MLNVRQWLVALGASLFVHGALFVVWPSLEGARGPGEQGVEIGLGLLGDLGDAAEEPAPEEPLVEEAEPPPEPEPPVEPEPEPVPEPVQVPVLPSVVRTAGPPVASPPLAPVDPPKPRPDAPRQGVPRPIGQAPAVASRAAGGKMGLRRSYAGVLAAHLNRYKTYPISARRQGREGTVTLRLVVDRSGRAIDARIVRNADFPAFDEAALEMLARAQPLPPFPDGMAETELVVMVPVSFELDRSD